MDKEKEIEEMAMKISARKSNLCDVICVRCKPIYKKVCSDYQLAKYLIGADYGNIKQAMEEFAAQVIKRADAKAIFQEWYNYEKLGGRLIGMDQLKRIIEDLRTELYGEPNES